MNEPELSAKNLDDMLADNSVLCQGAVVLPQETFEAFRSIWGGRFRLATPVMGGPRRDFRGWLSTPKGAREIWVGFVEAGRVSFRRKMPDNEFL